MYKPKMTKKQSVVVVKCSTGPRRMGATALLRVQEQHERFVASVPDEDYQIPW